MAWRSVPRSIGVGLDVWSQGVDDGGEVAAGDHSADRCLVFVDNDDRRGARNIIGPEVDALLPR
jgi:hypothetical protein